MALTIEIVVTPKASKRRFALGRSGELKCYLVSAPEKGKANAELIEFLASTLRLPKRSITFVSGQTDRKKRLSIDTSLSPQELLRALGIEKQLSIGE